MAGSPPDGWDGQDAFKIANAASTFRAARRLLSQTECSEDILEEFERQANILEEVAERLHRVAR